jgi:ureidoacrylate peracid hydrolase
MDRRVEPNNTPLAEAAVEPLPAARSALIVVDMTNDYLEPGGTFHCPSAPGVVEPLNRLLGGFRDAGGLIIFCRHILRADGADSGVADRIAARRWPEFLDGQGRPTVCTRDQDGSQLYAGLDRRDNDIVIEKNRYSAFGGSPLESILRAHDVSTLVVTGVATEGCCDATAKDAIARDLRTIFVSDCTAAFDYPDVGWGAWPAEAVQSFMCTLMAAAFGEVLTADAVTAALDPV